MNNLARIEKIQQLLIEQFAPTHLEIIDNSDKHRGHAGAANGAGHFAIVIASAVFANKPPLVCHRLIYAALTDLIPTEIHALEIKLI